MTDKAYRMAGIAPRIAALAFAGALAAMPRAASGQDAPIALNAADEAVAAAPVELGAGRAPARDNTGTALARGRYAVVIDLDQNKLFFKQGDVTLWSATVGTGTGVRLKAEDDEWKFSTPQGVFQVQYKEQNPVWRAPDWFFVENGLPIPPVGDPKRNFPGGLGAAAVYIGHDLAIHGTNKPELLGQRVSHGCIRLSNRDALRLFHNVQVGTEVVIVGGEDVKEQVVTPAQVQAEKAKATFDPVRPAPKDPVVERWRALSTRELLVVLDNHLWRDAESSRWAEVAALLMERGLEEKDDAALAGLMSRPGSLDDAARERELATFLADAFARNPFRTLETLSRLEWGKRAPAGRAIVEATMNLYHGEFDDAAAPWPTARVPRDLLEPSAWTGWFVLADAEKEMRRQ